MKSLLLFYKILIIMYRKPLISLLFILFVSAGFAQVKPFRFGVRVAPSLGWLSPDSKDYSNEATLPGFSWGFMADITLTQNYFIRTGFSIDYQNGKLSYPHKVLVDEVTSTYAEGTLYRKYNLRYLEFPLVLKMRTNQFGKTAFFGEIGFGASMNLKAKGKDEFIPDDGNPPQESEGDIKDDIRFFKGSMIVGAGLEYFIDESTSIVTSLSFNNGLTNILDGNNDVDESVKERATLYYFQLNIGILF